MSDQSMKPTAPCRNKISVIAATPSRGLSLSCWATGVGRQKPYAENCTLRKSAITGFSARRPFIKDCAESLAVIPKSPAVLFGK
jgi:hypothetical protein